MAKTPYYLYDPYLAAIFEYCDIQLEVSSYGSNQGWDPTEFQNAVNDAMEYIIDTETTDDDDLYLDILCGDFTISYWSTEGMGTN